MKLQHTVTRLVVALLILGALAGAYTAGSHGIFEKVAAGLDQDESTSKGFKSIDKVDQDELPESTLPKPGDFWSTSPFGPDWDPFKDMQNMHKHMDNLFEQAFKGFPGGAGPIGFRLDASMPEIKTKDTGDAYEVTCKLPGVDMDSVNINAAEDSIEISGKHSTRGASSANGGQFQTMSTGEFRQRFQLPGPVDESTLKSSLEKDTLTITLKKDDNGPSGLSIPLIP